MEPRLVCEIRDYLMAVVGMEYDNASRHAWNLYNTIVDIERPSKKRKITQADTTIGMWLSAALEDPSVCEEMKTDIEAWFDTLEVPSENQ